MEPLDKLRLLEAEVIALRLALSAICMQSPSAAGSVARIASLAEEITLPFGLDEDQREVVSERLHQIGQAPASGDGPSQEGRPA